MIRHSHEQVEEQLAAILHLVLHGAAALECVPATDDQGEIVRPQLRVVVGCVVVGVAGAAEDCTTLDAGL